MVQLKPFDIQNVALHYKWNNDEALSYYDSEYPHTYESFESFLKRIKSVADANNNTAELFEIHLAENDKLIGIVDIHAIDDYNKRCYVNCTIGDGDYTGQGCDLEALQIILDYCFSKKGLHKVATTAFDFNTSWIEKVKEMGFKKEGELREHVLKKGSFCNKLIFSILSHEFETKQEYTEALAEH
jgi:RimJ/RimL family protein N-acetyltransferase